MSFRGDRAEWKVCSLVLLILTFADLAIGQEKTPSGVDPEIRSYIRTVRLKVE
jgi:hypothetical protein